MRYGSWLSLALLTIALAGCIKPFESLEENWTLGTRGHLRVSWATGWGCFFGCALDRELMVGTIETLQIHPEDWPQSTAAATEQIQVQSSDTSVLRAEVIPVRIDRNEADEPTRIVPGLRVHALQPGVSTIRILDSDGELQDAVEISSSQADRILLITGDDLESSPPMQMSPMSEQTITARAWNSRGDALSASLGWTFSVEDADIAELWAGDLAQPDAGVSTLVGTENFVTILARSAGVTTVRGRVGDAETMVEVRVE